MKIIIFFGIIIGIIIFGSFFTISINFVFGDSDFVLELKNVTTMPTISKVEIEGENVQEMCPTDKCKLEFTNSSFIPPKPDNMTISHNIGFNLKYNGTNANLDSIENEHSEKFSESMNSCIIYDAIDDKGQKIFFCNNGTNSMIRNSDSKSWYYDSIGIYDAIKNTYTVKGDLIDNSTSELFNSSQYSSSIFCYYYIMQLFVVLIILKNIGKMFVQSNLTYI